MWLSKPTWREVLSVLAPTLLRNIIFAVFVGAFVAWILSLLVFGTGCGGESQAQGQVVQEQPCPVAQEDAGQVQASEDAGQVQDAEKEAESEAQVCEQETFQGSCVHEDGAFHLCTEYYGWSGNCSVPRDTFSADSTCATSAVGQVKVGGCLTEKECTKTIDWQYTDKPDADELLIQNLQTACEGGGGTWITL